MNKQNQEENRLKEIIKESNKQIDELNKDPNVKGYTYYSSIKECSGFNTWLFWSWDYTNLGIRCKGFRLFGFNIIFFLKI